MNTEKSFLTDLLETKIYPILKTLYILTAMGLLCWLILIWAPIIGRGLLWVLAFIGACLYGLFHPTL